MMGQQRLRLISNVLKNTVSFTSNAIGWHHKLWIGVLDWRYGCVIAMFILRTQSNAPFF